MKVIEKKLSEIKPYENNPRNNEDAVQYVANSLKNFGWKQPIVIDNDGVIVCGHTRFLAAKSLGMKTAPCVVADDLTEEQIKAYRLADNKTAEMAGWNFPLLDIELAEIETLDMADFGFQKVEFNFDGVDELDESNYQEPEKDKLECPNCHHVDSKSRFKKVE